jgi:hypothetical protein
MDRLVEMTPLFVVFSAAVLLQMLLLLLFSCAQLSFL